MSNCKICNKEIPEPTEVEVLYQDGSKEKVTVEQYFCSIDCEIKDLKNQMPGFFA